MLTRNQSNVSYIAPVLTGFGVGVIGSRFLLFFIKLAGHCQRGTSQSTFLLSWETGIGLGLVASYAMLSCERILVLWTCLIALAVSLIFYTMFVHNWYVKHKNRQGNSPYLSGFALLDLSRKVFTLFFFIIACFSTSSIKEIEKNQ